MSDGLEKFGNLAQLQALGFKLGFTKFVELAVCGSNSPRTGGAELQYKNLFRELLSDVEVREPEAIAATLGIRMNGVN